MLGQSSDRERLLAIASAESRSPIHDFYILNLSDLDLSEVLR
jgi:hypothetical protein